MSEAVTLLRDLIAIPSVNPAFRRAAAVDPAMPTAPGSRSSVTPGEAEVAGFLATEAQKLGIDVTFQDVLPGRRNLLARLDPAATARHTVLLAPHLDTVAAEPHAFQPRVVNGRVFGRGACDTKGSVAAMFAALRRVARTGPRPGRTRILFAGLVDEENEQRGSRTLAAQGRVADLAIVGEPTRRRVVTAHKGDLWLELVTRGVAAHGATPERGRNAVVRMAQVVVALETEYASVLRQGPQHPLLGHATVNVGAIAGGHQANIVPDRCAILIDRRTLPGETKASVFREIKAFLRQRGLGVELSDTKTDDSLPLDTEANQPFICALMRAARQRRPVGVQFFCDASVLAQGGTPSVVFGPGDIAQAHTADEWVAVEEIERAADTLEAFLRGLP